MRFFKLEHTKTAYWADFALYSLAVVMLSGLLIIKAANDHHLIKNILLGLITWTAIEYVLHRFVLHGLQPFKNWHSEHHARPTALICAPTIVSATLIMLLVFLPALYLGSLWGASAFTLGVLIGYLTYAIMHHAIHHSRINNQWIKQRKLAHGLHHHLAMPVYFGVTSSFWDMIFNTIPNKKRA